jgi:hypothetical protein
MSGIQTRVFYNQNLDKVASLTLLDSSTGSMVFLMGRNFLPNIVEKMDELSESGEFNSYCFHQTDTSFAETIMFIVKRQQGAQCAFTDFSALVTDWIHEMS